MNKLNVAKLVKNAQTTLSKHSPEILTGIGVTGVITTVVLSVKATPKALRLIEEEKQKKNTDELQVLDVIKVAWKPYIPAAITGVSSIACIIGATSVNASRNAALAAAYKLSETALVEYREKVIETIGEKKERVIRDKVDEEHIKKNPIVQNDVIITGGGKTLFLDSSSGRAFESDIEKIRRIENELNKRMLQEMFGEVSLNELYDEIGLPRIDIGDRIGWNAEHLIDLHFGAQMLEDGRVCAVLSHNTPPMYDFYK
jgi:hypothetical protein